MSPELIAELDHAVTKRNLQCVAEEIRKNATECYALIAEGNDDYSTIGNTRFGGDPDLPSDIRWPSVDYDGEERFCNFIAQINFAELPPLASETGLPSHGILYLFVRDMDCAAWPVDLEARYFEGALETLSRTQSPDPDSLLDEYLVDLIPQRIRAVPAVSLANYRKQFRQHIEENVREIDGEDGDSRRFDLDCDLNREGQIGQLLGFANAGDERKNLYRQVALSQLGKRHLDDCDYWDSMEEYEADIEKWQNNEQLVKNYQGMREGVEWLTSNREMIADEVDQWRLLFQLQSNSQMNLNINDADPLYVFIKHTDLMNRNFSDIAGEVTQG
tara:strand:+ start:17919 stop:18911 length:993 start_codon:yes stop_codon:yes gene_type:complete